MKSVLSLLALVFVFHFGVVSMQEDATIYEVKGYVPVSQDGWLFRRRPPRGKNHYGASCKAACRINNQNWCGTGTIVGIDDEGYSLILTNAHVAGTTIGHTVNVYVESVKTSLKADVIMAAYSDEYLADWAILRTQVKFNKVKPVKLNTRRPTGSHYTKGFPRCQPMTAGDVNMVTLSKNSPLAKWNPNAIGGQSGSGVFNDRSGYIECLLTWSWSGYGAGQMTSEIYKQAMGKTSNTFMRVPGLIEIDKLGHDGCCGLEPEQIQLTNGFFSEDNITDLPIWANVPLRDRL